MTIHEFNAADETVARAALLRCCGSEQWTVGILARRPFPDRETLLAAAESVWSAVAPSDWLEAFSAHPKIGEKKLSSRCAAEQSGLNSAAYPILEQLAKGNQDYEQRFGWIFLVNATGKTAPAMLDLLHLRLKNGSAEELRIAAGEQAEITKLRLNKLLNP